MNTKILIEWAEALYMPLPETWDAAAVDALCVWLCEYYGHAGMYFANMNEAEEREIKELLAQKKQAQYARPALQQAEERLRHKAPFFADEVKNLIDHIADAMIARADDAQSEGITFEPRIEQRKRTSGRPEKPTSAQISELEKNLDNILIASGEDVQIKRAECIATLVSRYFPEHSMSPGAVIQRII